METPIFYGQAEQDKFVLNMTNFKRDGYFLEIGSNHPISINNTYKLEKEYNWKGIMVEYNPKFLASYKEHRPNSFHIIQNAIVVDYKKALEDNHFPTNMDYLQVDLEANNGSTLHTLFNLDRNVLPHYKFATVTFEHDIYYTNYMNTREVSRQIFDKYGYVRMFADIHNIEPQYVYEDWYVHPELVDMEKVHRLMEKNSSKYVPNSIINGISLSWKDIDYS
jgi:hypothetical protein